MWNACSLLQRWFSTFLMPWPFSARPHAVLTPNNKIILLPLPKYNFATVTNLSVNIWYARYQICIPCESGDPQAENHCSMGPPFFLGLYIHATVVIYYQALWNCFSVSSTDRGGSVSKDLPLAVTLHLAWWLSTVGKQGMSEGWVCRQVK